MYATGNGSLPGSDMPGALRHVLGSFEHAWLPELPARGIGADMVGRTTALLVGLGVDLQPQGWRLTDASGVDHGRARGLLRRDLDELEEAAQAFSGTITLTAAGPWTLAACLERPRGDKVLADHGARRELADSLALGLADLVVEMGRRLPAAAFTVQLDEPLLPAVLSGRVPTASGFSRLRAVDRPLASELLGRVTGRLESPTLHCCAPGLDLDLVGRSGVAGVALDVDQLRGADLDQVSAWIEDGRQLRLGLVPTARPDEVLSADRVVERGLALLRPLGLDPALLVEQVSISPACGLAGWSTAAAARQDEYLLQAADLLAEQLQR
ncbi:hypothetical protein [Luteococcus peritonei]|uniref:Cobalamin-independent methionine synthase MetE C-terminal/archaeal domain-containing protein n=1 Tax=Luteococcus peritonei TaxID=88874 RepID=A0ABW4RZC0_9ACTN